MSVGKVYLVGAGPGDPGLLTLRGKEVLSQAQVVIYDYLANPELVEFAPADAERIYVGKKGGDHTVGQEGINRLLVEKGRDHVVVRLKGGDPFVFGRGGEEAEDLVAAGIPFEMVPGVTAAVAVPAYAGIPLSHRDYSASIGFVTGHERDDKESSNLAWDKLATGVGTLDRLAQEIVKSQRANLPLALLLIDLDEFKEVNDTLGHDVGDVLLQEAARRIRSCVRDADTVARLGGDEFSVLLTELPDRTTHIEDIAQTIIVRLAEPFPLGNEMAYVSASIGITLFPQDAGDIDTLMKHADQAMYAAKKQGRNRFCYFTASLQDAAQTRLKLSRELREAVAGNQFTAHFQPIVELSSGRIHKAEALLRWQHPTRGLVNPMTFIPLAEETGLINAIGAWVFSESAQRAKAWRSQFGADFQVSVNMSPVQFRTAGRMQNLSILRQFLAQLPDDIHHLSHTGPTHRVAARFQSAGNVDRDLTTQSCFTSSGGLAALTLFKETDVFALGDFQDGKSIMQFSHIDVRRLELGHGEGLLRRQADGLEIGGVVALGQRVRIRGLAEASDDDT